MSFFLPVVSFLLHNPTFTSYIHVSCLTSHGNFTLIEKHRVSSLIPLYYWLMMAIGTSAFSNAIENNFFFLNWFQLALISWIVSYLKTAVKPPLISLIEVVHSKSSGKPFSLDAFVSSAIDLISNSITLLASSCAKGNRLSFAFEDKRFLMMYSFLCHFKHYFMKLKSGRNTTPRNISCDSNQWS